jgi:hypothetical protein
MLRRMLPDHGTFRAEAKALRTRARVQPARDFEQCVLERALSRRGKISGV